MLISIISSASWTSHLIMHVAFYLSPPPPPTHTHTLGDWKDNVVHMVILSIFIQTGICFALNLCVSERRHFDMLFTSEVQKHDGS